MADFEDKKSPIDEKDLPPADVAEEAQEGKEGEEGEEGKGEGDLGELGRAEVEVGEGFYAYMSSIGASVSQISEILKSWRHLRGKGLLQALKDFAGRKARASAHAEVEIDKGKDFSLLQNILNHFKSLREAAPEQELKHDHQADVRHRPGGPGSQGPSL